MATIKELYGLCKKKQKEDKEQTIKEVSVTFMKKKKTQ